MIGGIILLLDFGSLNVKKLKFIDLWIVIPYLILLGIGVVMVYSASFYNNMVNGGSTTQYLVKQAFYVVLGLILCYIVFSLRLSILKSRGILSVLGLITLISLIVLLIMGVVNPSSRVNGASAWLTLGPINFQPLELAKLVFVLYLALVLSNKEQRLTDAKFGHIIGDNWRQIAFLLVIILLVGIQPDFGGAFILGIITLVMISASSIPTKIISILDGSIVAAGVVFMSVVLIFKPSFLISGYKYQRIMAMLHPFQLEQKAGAQLVNSFYAISNGGIFGVGLGNSIQKRGYLPEPHTDFILAIISEELGVIGVLVVLGLLALIIFRLLLVGLRTKNTYTSLVLYGIATIFFTQIFLNVGGLLGFIPLTGVTLPFISYGGSSMMILSVALGIALNLEATEKFQSKKLR
ncbi:cell division protein FtsW [Companilactobacillus versmoldensis DSM 14857 = KCTC 3814]|uniref:Probable peptidoglycan glycosyltransferase FtsW n=1 Tax=Companilactobacillus versmoldensis DSM 14857 = KCTC 3814 TaxID=1423815 RepID=A0A0R1SMX1_9LACO|nr:cell division protein FtsW [Companilactobacillus versmoldensis DSM 14857 = KCTC 3814]